MNIIKKLKAWKESLNPVIQEILSWLDVLVAAALIALFINSVLIANSTVPTGSMETTVMSGDRVMGSRLYYLSHDPERGDIVIFRWPDNEKIYYVKRLIGMPGETVEIKGGQVYIDGEPLDEPYIREPMNPNAPDMRFEVPEGSYFMLGDNRNYSRDSRYWNNPFVKKEKFIAKVLFRYYPNIADLRDR